MKCDRRNRSRQNYSRGRRAGICRDMGAWVRRTMAETSIRRLPVNLDELAYALHESSQFGAADYLDLDTGEIVMITDEIRAAAEQISEMIAADAENYDAAFEKALAESDQ